MLKTLRALLSVDIRQAVRLLKNRTNTSWEALRSADTIQSMHSYSRHPQLQWLRAACLIEGMSKPDEGGVFCTQTDLSCFKEPELKFGRAGYDRNFRLPQMPRNSTGVRFLRLIGYSPSTKQRSGPTDERTTTLTDLAVEALYTAAEKSSEESLRKQVLKGLPRLPGVCRFSVVGELYKTNLGYSAQKSLEETRMCVYATSFGKSLRSAYRQYHKQLVEAGYKVDGKKVNGGKLELCLFSSYG